MIPISKEYENINKHIFGDITEGNRFAEPSMRYSFADGEDLDNVSAKDLRYEIFKTTTDIRQYERDSMHKSDTVRSIANRGLS
jgi:hypothetical protein